MEQKVIQVGNSLAITLPTQFVKNRKLKAGQKVFVDANTDPEMIHVSIGKKPIPSITPEFKQWLEAFNKKYKDALTELANK